MSMILALSDTHLNGPLPDNKYPLRLRELIEEADLMLHAGDFVCQGAYNDMVRLCKDAKCELWALRGNNLCPDLKEIVDENGVQLPGLTADGLTDWNAHKAENWFGINIGLIHGVCQPYGLSDVLPAAENNAQGIEMTNTGEKGADLLVFGHIHEPIIKWYREGSGKMRLLVCPGRASTNGLEHYCPPCPTVASLECHNGSISSAEIIAISWP
jgi:putative phosphoesterase